MSNTNTNTQPVDVAPQAQKCADWLRTLPGVISARPVSVYFNTGGARSETIGGALYVQELTPPVGARNPAPYRRMGIYLRRLPACYVRRIKPPRNRGESAVVHKRPVCFKPDSASGLDVHEWYIGGYYVGEAREPYQPMGENALMFPWDVDGKVDDGERTTYTRIPVEVRDV